MDQAQRIKQYIEENLILFDDPQSLIGGEANTTFGESFDTAKVRILHIRLSSYNSVSISQSQGLMGQIYRHSMQPGEVFTDFAYMPTRKDFELLVAGQVPVLFGRSSKRPAMEFDIISVTNAIVTEMMNVPPLWESSGIPLTFEQRMADPKCPLIIVGGPNASGVDMLSGHIVDKEKGIDGYSFVDAAHLGGAELVVPLFIKEYHGAMSTGSCKMEFLTNIQKNPKVHGGWYVPCFYQHYYENERLKEIEPKNIEFPKMIHAKHEFDLNKVPNLTENPIYYDTPMSGAADVTISHGCTGCGGNCAFCREGWEYGAYRERSKDTLMPQIMEARRLQGSDEVNFFSFNFNMHSQLYSILDECVRTVGQVNLISQRTDILANDPQQAQVQRALKKRTFTIGVEGISQRLRNYMNKNLSEVDLLKGIAALIDAQAVEIKLFYIPCGLEEEADVKEFTEFMKKVMEYKEKKESTISIRLSFCCFMASPNTPLQFSENFSVTKIKEDTLREIVNLSRRYHLGFRTSQKRSEVIIEQLLTLGNRQLSQLIYDGWKYDKVLFYGMIPKGMDERWLGRMRGYGLNPDNYFKEKDMSYVFPWDIFNFGCTKEYLYKEFLKRKTFQETKYCLKTVANTAPKCLNCGACPDASHKKTILNHSYERAFAGEYLESVRRNMTGVSKIRFMIDIQDPVLRVVNKNYFGRAIARAFMMRSPDYDRMFLRMQAYSRSEVGSRYRDWVIGRVIYDMIVSEHPNTEDLRANLVDMNGKLLQPSGWKITDFRISEDIFSLKDISAFALYDIDAPVSSLELEQMIGRWEQTSALKINKKVAKGKGSFRTVSVHLDKEDIIGFAYSFTGTGVNKLYMWASNKLPIYNLLSAFGIQWKKTKYFNIKIKGYYKPSLGLQTGLMSLLYKSKMCESCGTLIDYDEFTGKQYESVHDKDRCILCDLV